MSRERNGRKKTRLKGVVRRTTRMLWIYYGHKSLLRGDRSTRLYWPPSSEIHSLVVPRFVITPLSLSSGWALAFRTFFSLISLTTWQCLFIHLPFLPDVNDACHFLSSPTFSLWFSFLFSLKCLIFFLVLGYKVTSTPGFHLLSFGVNHNRQRGL